MVKKIIFDKKKENSRIGFCNGNILFINNSGTSHVFENALDERKKNSYGLFGLMMPTKVKKTSYRKNPAKKIVRTEGSSTGIEEPCIKVISNGFIGESGRKYELYSNDKGNSSINKILQFDNIMDCVVFTKEEYIVFALFNDGTLHSWNKDHNKGDFVDNVNFSDESVYDNTDLSAEIIGQTIKSIHYIECDGEEGIIAIDDMGDIYQIGSLPKCIDEFFEGDEVLSMISVDNNGNSAFLVGLNENNRLVFKTDYSIESFEDEGYRDFFVTMKYIKNVVDFAVYDKIGAAVNTDGKIELWGDYELVKEYENRIPPEFLAD